MKFKFIAMSLAMVTVLSYCAVGQTSGFNFQGRLNDGTQPANGRYDLQFKLFTAIAGGTQVGATVDRPNLTLINGVFSTTLDFGSSAFSGGVRFIEISVRPNGSPNSYVILGARQQIMSVPFAIRAASAASADFAANAATAENAISAQDSSSLGGVAAGNYARLSFANPGNFSISGNAGLGTATPNTRLTLTGGPQWTTNQWTASMNMQNGSALGWEANSSGQRFGIGQTTGGLQFFRTTSGFGSTLTPAQTDVLITDNGDLAQPLDRNGLVKAVAAVTANGTIARCYDGVTGSALCNGFSVVCSPTVGQCIVTFPFQISNRFWLAIPDSTSRPHTEQNTVNIRLDSQNSLSVFLWSNGSRTLLAFHIFIF